MRRYRVSRLKQLIFPQELIIDKFHVLSRKRHFPAFWAVKEESIPLSKLASIQIHRGLFFSKLIIENAGGPYPIIVDGLWNRAAKEARDLLEMIEREMMKRGNVAELVGEDEEEEEGEPPGRDNPGPPGNYNPEPPSEPEDHQVPQANDPGPVESSHEGDIESIAREIIDGLSDQPGNTSTPPVALHAGLFDVRKIVDDGRDLPSEDFVKTEMKAEPTRGVGEVPENWEPPAPWSPARKPEPKEIDGPGYPEVDPVEFLNSEPVMNHEPVLTQAPDPVVLTLVETPKRKKVSQVRKLVNWWNNTRDEINFKPPRTRKRKRKLN